MQSENIKVCIRVRPPSKKEDSDLYVHVDSKKNFIEISENGRETQQFAFDDVFDSSITQEKIFTTIAKDAVDMVCQGYNATIFAYGATSSGKSFTMFGTSSKPGLIPRCCQLLFQNINNKDDVVDANMKCSFLEIYREQIRDLLSSDSENNLKLRQSSVKGVYVQSLIEKYVYTSQDILSTLHEGTLQRTTASTALNSVSSRSHAVVTLTLTQKLNDGSEVVSKLNLVDLAGSENVDKSEVQGIELSEAQTINKSLSSLGNVIYALTEKGRGHIPYRDSKLTYLLQDSLGGNSKTILIATINPSKTSYSETISTLKFAKRAKEIKNIPKVNKNESTVNLIKTLNEKISELENKCLEYQEELQKYTTEKPLEQNNSTEKLVILQKRCERLEKKILFLEEQKKNDEIQNNQLKELFDKQRELAKKSSQDLYNERVKISTINNELEQLRMFYTSTQETVGNPDVLTLIVNRSKIILNNI